MDAQTIIARRIARELRDGMLVNLGIGIPTLVANYISRDVQIFFQSENGLIGTGPIPEQGMAHPLLTDAGGRPVTALPGASTFDSAMSFGLIRGGHVDVTVLGGLQVDSRGLLANWMIPGKMVPGMGGAMDLVTGAKRVIIAMQHTAKGKAKLVKQCTLPLTSSRPIDLLVTELAVIAFPDGRATLRETAPGVTVEQVMSASEAKLALADTGPDAVIGAAFPCFLDLLTRRCGAKTDSMSAEHQVLERKNQCLQPQDQGVNQRQGIDDVKCGGAQAARILRHDDVVIVRICVRNAGASRRHALEAALIKRFKEDR